MTFQKIYVKSNQLETEKRMRLSATFCDHSFRNSGQLKSKYEKRVCKNSECNKCHFEHGEHAEHGEHGGQNE